jgi:hypothetical protein
VTDGIVYGANVLVSGDPVAGVIERAVAEHGVDNVAAPARDEGLVVAFAWAILRA